MQLAGPLRSPLAADLALVVTWSSGFIGAELSSRAGADPMTLLGWRFLLLALLLVGVYRALGNPWPSRASWRRQSVVAVLCQPAYLLLIFEGVAHGVPGGTAALSGFTQATGYLLAFPGPFGVGILHDVSGGWTVPLLVLLAINVPQLFVALAVSRPAYVEDELDAAGRDPR